MYMWTHFFHNTTYNIHKQKYSTLNINFIDSVGDTVWQVIFRGIIIKSEGTRSNNIIFVVLIFMTAVHELTNRAKHA